MRWLATLLVLLAAAPGPVRGRGKMEANEGSALGFLRTLTAAQEAFKTAGHVDQDGDGIGEYATLRELAGLAIPRSAREAVHPPYAGYPAGSVSRRSGMLTKSGYHFLLYLPTLRGWKPEPAGPLPADPAGADLQEGQYLVYAWPVEYGKTGRRAFLLQVQPGREEQFLVTDNDGRWFGLAALPAAADGLRWEGLETHRSKHPSDCPSCKLPLHFLAVLLALGIGLLRLLQGPLAVVDLFVILGIAGTGWLFLFP